MEIPKIAIIIIIGPSPADHTELNELLRPHLGPES